MSQSQPKKSFKKKWGGGGKKKDDARAGRYFKPGDKLAKFPGEAGKGMDHNYFPWYREWEVKIGEYGEEFKEQFAAGEVSYAEPEEKKNEYTYKTKKCMDSQAFTYTDKQIEHIDSMKKNNDSQLKIDNYMAICFEKWFNKRAEDNAEIERDNTFNAEKIKGCVKDSKEYRDKATKLFSNILTSMSETSRNLVRAYKSVPEIDGEEEAELIAANTVCDYYVWLHECLGAIGLRDESPGILYQDNKSTITISEKGAGSFKRTKHIRVRYFWISELVKGGELQLEFVPTGEMVADILTKPTVGHTFRYLLERLLGLVNKPGVNMG